MFNLFTKDHALQKEKKTIVREEMSEEELMLKFAEHFGDIGEYQVDIEEERRMFEELQSVDYLQPYLRATIAKDMQLYFAATTDQQRDLIKGRIARSAYLRSKLVGKSDNQVVNTKMKGLRYAQQ